MRQWLDEGLITFRFDETNGVENTLDVHKDVHGRQYREINRQSLKATRSIERVRESDQSSTLGS